MQLFPNWQVDEMHEQLWGHSQRQMTFVSRFFNEWQNKKSHIWHKTIYLTGEHSAFVPTNHKNVRFISGGLMETKI